MPSNSLCLLSLDGGGVRGLSTLYILREIMVALNHARAEAGEPPVKPCDVFDLIGGTSTGGLIAIMLGRLSMDVDECIESYTQLSESIFSKKESRLGLGIKGNLKARFSSQKLREAIEAVLKKKGFALDEPFNDKQTGTSRSCRVFVCSCDRATKDILRIKSYDIPGKSTPIRPLTIVEAALATSAAPSFFDKIDIDDVVYLDGALGANNPVKQVVREASDIWFKERGEPDLQENVKCVLSLGTGHLGISPVRDDTVYKFLSETLKKMATDTEKIAEEFADSWRGPLDKGCYFRFNVQHGLEGVSLEEHKKKGVIQSATRSYLEQRTNQLSVGRCVTALKNKESNEFQLQIYHPFRFERIARRWEIWFGQKLCDDIFERISDYDPDYNLRLITRQKCPRTTEWILSDPSYRVWETETAGTLWLTGKIGSGKTFITSTVVEDRSGNNFVGHYFFQPLRPSHLKAGNLFRSFIWQMVAFMDALGLQVPHDIVSDIIRIFGPRSYFPLLSDIVNNVLLPLAKEMARYHLKNFYIVDGLDACTQEESSYVLTSFSDLARVADCHIFISTREGPVNLNEEHIIHLSERHTRDDIRIFIDWRMEQKQRIEGHLTSDEKLRVDVIEILNDRAHLMTQITSTRILWVTLQIDAIWDCTTDQEIRQALADLPETLTETYLRCAIRVRKPLGPQVLAHICATLIPFQIAELQEILAIDATTGKLLRDIIPQERAIIKSCAGLIIRSEDDIILPTHHSVNLFLEKHELQLGTYEGKFNIQELRLDLGELCVKHLTGPDYTLHIAKKEPQFTMDLMPGSFLQAPLLPSWSRFPTLFGRKKKTPIHFDASMAATIRKLEPQLSYLSAFRYARANWALLTRQISPQSSSWQRFKELVLGKRSSWDVLPWSPSGQSLDSRYQDILGWAVKTSHEPMLYILLHESIPKPRKEIYDLPLPQYEDCLPISLAIRAKSVEIFKSLLPYCTKLIIPQLMCLAAESGFVHGIDAILDYSYDDIAYPTHTITPLALATEFGHYDFVARLFHAPFRPSASQMSDALSVASRTGNCIMIQTLLQLGVPIELPQNETTIPLEETVRCGHLDAVHILLQAGAALEYGCLNPPILKSVELNHVHVTQALLDYGAKPNYSNAWPTLLHMAIDNGSLNMVQLLLQRGADPNWCPVVEPTPLDLAAKKALPQITQLLLQYGARVHETIMRNSRSATILHWASIGGSVEILKIFTSAQAQQESRRKYAAKIIPFDEYVADCLLSGTNSRDQLERSAIMIAAALGNVSAFEYLIENGSNINSMDDSGINVLMYACGAELQNDEIHFRIPYPGAVPSGKLDDFTTMVELLCSRGAHLNKRDDEGKTAFMYAARQYNLGTLKVLFRYGVDFTSRANVEGKSCYQQNALSYALAGDRSRINDYQYMECIDFLEDLGL